MGTLEAYAISMACTASAHRSLIMLSIKMLRHSIVCEATTRARRILNG